MNTKKKLIIICCCLAVMLATCTIYATESTTEKKIAKLAVKTYWDSPEKGVSPNINIEGYLTDNETGKPLPNQSIVIESYDTYSDRFRSFLHDN